MSNMTVLWSESGRENMEDVCEESEEEEIGHD